MSEEELLLISGRNNKNNTEDGNSRSTHNNEIFMGCVSSLDGDLGIIDQETIFHICAVRGTVRPKVGDNVLFKAEAVQNMSKIKWNAKEVQVLKIKIDPGESQMKFLPVPPAPRISGPPLYSESERSNHSSQKPDIEETKYSTENLNLCNPRKRRLHDEKSSAATSTSHREVKHRKSSESSDETQDENEKSIQMTCDPVENSSPENTVTFTNPELNGTHELSPIVSASTETQVKLEPNIGNLLSFKIKEEPQEETFTELNEDSPANDSYLKSLNSTGTESSELLFGETGTNTSSDEHIETDLTILTSMSVSNRVGIASIDSNDEIPTPTDFTEITIENFDFEPPNDLQTAYQLEKCTIGDFSKDIFRNSDSSTPSAPKEPISDCFHVENVTYSSPTVGSNDLNTQIQAEARIINRKETENSPVQILIPDTTNESDCENSNFKQESSAINSKVPESTTADSVTKIVSESTSLALIQNEYEGLEQEIPFREKAIRVNQSGSRDQTDSAIDGQNAQVSSSKYYPSNEGLLKSYEFIPQVEPQPFSQGDNYFSFTQNRKHQSLHPSGESLTPILQRYSTPPPLVKKRRSRFSSNQFHNTRQGWMRPLRLHFDFPPPPFKFNRRNRFLFNQRGPTFCPLRVPWTWGLDNPQPQQIEPEQVMRKPLADEADDGPRSMCRICGKTGHNESTCFYRGSASGS